VSGRRKGPGRYGPLAYNQERPPVGVAFAGLVFRRRPTLPPPGGGSTIGAGGLSFRVRDGSGRFPAAVAAETWVERGGRSAPGGASPGGRRVVRRGGRARGGWGWLPAVAREPHSGRGRVFPRGGGCGGQVLGLLVPVGFASCDVSTSGLSTQWSGWGPYPVVPVGDLILKQASRLDAFSGYPFRTWPTSGAPGGTTGTPEVRPSRSSRTRDSPSQVSCARSG
jgi:hypothetical protein